MKRVFPLLLAGVLLAGLFVATAVAAKSPDADKQIEASMVVTGSIEVEPDGSVSGYTLDQPDKLPQGVRDLIARAVPEWKFKPVLVDGKAVASRAKMSLRMVAHPLAADRYEVLVRSANFGDTGPSDEDVRGKSLPPPRYPSSLARQSVSGTVYLVLRVGRDGRVVDAVAEQVNLKTRGSEKQMEDWRKTFAKSALAAAWKWTFTPPTAGDAAADEAWSVRVPVAFSMWGTAQARYGQWDAYIPGQRVRAPWLERELSASMAPDAIGDSGVFSLRQSLQLLTPLGQG